MSNWGCIVIAFKSENRYKEPVGLFHNVYGNYYNGQ